MINHRLQCIFIHIPRTGGTSIESALCGQDWWQIAPAEKHLIASQARAVYAEYWDSYFKFSFVRHPFTRFASMAKYPEMFFGERLKRVTSQSIDSYRRRYGAPVTIEYDWRFFGREDVEGPWHESGTIYANSLDEELDFIGRFETLAEDFRMVCKHLQTRPPVLPAVESSNRTHAENDDVLTQEARTAIQCLWWKDFVRFGYSMRSAQTTP